jgi:hypothetical protein
MIRVAKYKRPNGYWYVRYFLAGQRCDESTKTTSESGAESYRLRREIEINAGRAPQPTRTTTALLITLRS